MSEEVTIVPTDDAAPAEDSIEDRVSFVVPPTLRLGGAAESLFARYPMTRPLAS